MKPQLPLLPGALLGLLGLVVLLGTTDTAHAQTFNPTLEITLADTRPLASSDIAADFNLPEGDVNFGGVVAFIPAEWEITPGDEIPVGTIVGRLTSTATLGLINGTCSNVLPVVFILQNGSLDITDTVAFEDADENLTEDFAEDKDGNGLLDSIDRYPAFINRVLVDEDDNPLQPIRRAAGVTVIAGVNVLLQFLIFEPGTFISDNIPNDPELGFPSVTLLQNIGDPELEPVPGVITDFCTPLLTSNTSLGVSKDNGCTEAIPVDELDPICSATGAIVVEEGGTTPDEGGHVLFRNPAEPGTYTFTTVALGLRDADGDGYENFLDTCALVVNVGDPRIGDGDEDSDGLDAACDPQAQVTNSDEDLDGYLNRGDNCPLVANGENEDNQADADDDLIGDACDPNPDNADSEGELSIAVLIQDVTISGEPAEVPDGAEPGGEGDDDGSSGTLIIIIVIVIAVVVVGGGGVFLYMRRGSGGGDATA